ncbi:hypothetical protein KNO15_13820 [Leifsonia shinshuensis]|uniref:hypothetical protein n=1 Tax=Leifsonia shinshuensis TaxID=150026 RepID=UPI001F511B85|nr:hypothetical protein [Leifsonia shinshuensis]MCI0157774.1 hypothetical protein [Leifsonia shinshuensis]
MADDPTGNRTVPRPLPGLSAYEINDIAIPPVFIGFGVALLSIPIRFGLIHYDPSYFWPMFITAWTGVGFGLVMLGVRKLKEKKERAAGYVTIEGFPDLIRLDRRTGAVLRLPGEPEPTGSQIREIRRRARVEMRGAKR